MLEINHSPGNNYKDKKVAIKIANTTEFPYTLAADTKVAELQILKPEETKMIRPVDIAALNLLTEHDDVVTYINALMQVERPENNEEKFWFPTSSTRPSRRVS